MKLLNFWFSLFNFFYHLPYCSITGLVANFLNVALIHKFQQGLASKFLFWSHSRLKDVLNWLQFHWDPNTHARKYTHSCMQHTHNQSSKMTNYELNIYSFEWQFCFFQAKSLFHLDSSWFFSSHKCSNLNLFLFLGCLSKEDSISSVPLCKST